MNVGLSRCNIPDAREHGGARREGSGVQVNVVLQQARLPGEVGSTGPLCAPTCPTPCVLHLCCICVASALRLCVAQMRWLMQYSTLNSAWLLRVYGSALRHQWLCVCVRYQCAISLDTSRLHAFAYQTFNTTLESTCRRATHRAQPQRGWLSCSRLLAGLPHEHNM